ncbi:hypothetical protein ACI3L1_06535 [Deinococcus sp. SM5_A1]|uniref:hypothetical protein n=1 Tax=Deinococcus sp. SM5_A1 TaxID=3379094 RepID=UPI00385C999F
MAEGEPPARLTVWSRFLELSQAGPTRRWLSQALIVASDVLSPIILAAAGYFAYIRQIPTQSLTSFILFMAVLTGLAKIFKYGLELYAKAQQATRESLIEEEVATAGSRVFGHWREVSRHHEDGIENANRQLQGVSFNQKQTVDVSAIDSYLKAVIAVFRSFYEGEEFTANLVVPNEANDQLWLVRIEPGGGGRSNNIPRSFDLQNDAWGITESFKQARIIYTEDVRQYGGSGERGYLSVINMPVLGSSGQVVALVNIDSPKAATFGSLERVIAAADYCRPILSSLSLCLNDPRLFKVQRQ